MTAMLRAGIRSAVFWQVVAGFALGTVGTLAARDADAARPPAHSHAAQHWRIDR